MNRIILNGRTQKVVVKGSVSAVISCAWGIPQGSALRPVLFSLYTAPVERLMHCHGPLHSAYADDVNVYSSIDPARPDICPAINAVHALHNWYIRNGMLPNPNKSEVLMIDTPTQLAKLPQPLHIEEAEEALQVHCLSARTRLSH